MGIGKTIQAIGIMTIYKEDWPVLILCPSSLKFSWRDEIKNWLSEIINLEKEDIQVFKTSKDIIKSGEKFYIISYDLAIRNINIIQEKKFKCAIADEAHYMKNLDAKRSKLLIPILQRCKRLILLTGTPILAKPVEIYPLLTALRPDFFHSFKQFGERFCNPIQTIYGLNWNGNDNIRELHFILKKIMIRRLKNEVLSQLPPKKRQKIEIQTDTKIINQIKVILKSKKDKLKNFINSEEKTKEIEKNIDNAIAVCIAQEEAIFFCRRDGDIVETNDCRVAIRFVNGREIDSDVGAIGIEGEIHFLPSSLVFERRTRSQCARLTSHVDADVATQARFPHVGGEAILTCWQTDGLMKRDGGCSPILANPIGLISAVSRLCQRCKEIAIVEVTTLECGEIIFIAV